MMLARNKKRLLAMVMAIVMCLGLVSTSALATVKDTEFHIMELDAIKSYLSNENAGAEDITIQSIYVSDGEKQATGGGVNEERTWHGEPYWYVLNTCDIINSEAITGIVIHYCVNGSATTCVIPSSMLRIEPLSGLSGLITEIYPAWDTSEPDPEPELQTVYVYVQAKEGQGSLNEHDYFTLGTIQLPLDKATWDDTGDGEARYEANSQAISDALADIQLGGYNDWINLNDVEWYSLHAADGADNYVDSGTMTWHLDGKIKDDVQLYYVTYDLNDGEGTVPTDPNGYAAGQEFQAADGTGLTKDGYEFAGWSTDEKATKPDETFAIPLQGGDVTLYAVWTPKQPAGPELQITKEAASNTAKPGDEVEYTITVKNVGTEPADVTVQDQFPSQLQPVDESTVTQGNGPVNFGNYLAWQVGSLAAGAEAVMTVKMKVADDASGDIVNTAIALIDNVETASDDAVVTVSGSEIVPDPEEGVVTITKVVELPDGVELPEGYEVTLTLSQNMKELGKVTFTKADLANGTASKDIQLPVGTYSELRLDEMSLAWDGYTCNATGIGNQDEIVVSADQPVMLSVTNHYESTSPDPSDDPSDDPTTTPSYEPDDEEDEEIDLPDSTTPLNPGPTEETPTEIPEDTTPLNPAPTEETPTEIPEDTTPLNPAPEGSEESVEIVDENVALGSLPQTGAVAAPVNPAVTAGLVALSFSLAGCGLYFTFGRKKGEEED